MGMYCQSLELFKLTKDFLKIVPKLGWNLAYLTLLDKGDETLMFGFCEVWKLCCKVLKLAGTETPKISTI